MTLMCTLYCLSMLNEDSHGLYECGYFSSGVEYNEMILDAMKAINGKLRPKILPIVESIEIRDEML